jgi:hypothetical protein
MQALYSHIPQLVTCSESRSEGDAGACGVSELVQIGLAGELDHWWRAAHQNLKEEEGGMLRGGNE